MRLEDISANIRYRNIWEGLDLGFVMARHWFFQLWGLWWMAAAPVILLDLLLYLLHGSISLTTSVIWWFKPLYEPFLLYWLSRRLFGEELSRREVVKRWRQILKPRLLANLTFYRFSLNRSFFMPVSHLEGLRGNDRRARLRILSGTQSGGSWLTIVGVHIEAAFAIGFTVLLLYLIPSPDLLPETMLELLASDQSWLEFVYDLFWLLSISLVAPFYVAGGFALYLTRRSQLEAWDLELAFRRMEPRFKGKSKRRLASIVASLFIVVFLLSVSNDGQAAPELTREESQQVITEVLNGPDFGTPHEESYWRYIGKPDDPETNLEWDSDLLTILANLLEYLLWITGAVLIGFAIFYISRLLDWLPKKKPQSKKSDEPPTILFGMPITPSSLPDNIPRAIGELLENGQLRTALSLLYRATLTRLVHDHKVRIPDSATENECRRIVVQARPNREADFFTRLTQHWVRCAYGHRDPETSQVLELADAWRGLYQGQAHE